MVTILRAAIGSTSYSCLYEYKAEMSVSLNVYLLSCHMDVKNGVSNVFPNRTTLLGMIKTSFNIKFMKIL